MRYDLIRAGRSYSEVGRSISLLDLADFITGAIQFDPSTVLYRLFGAAVDGPAPASPPARPREKSAAEIRAELARATA